MRVHHCALTNRALVTACVPLAQSGLAVPDWAAFGTVIGILIKVPALLFHGTLDGNVGYLQSKRLAQKLKAAGARVDLVTFKDLDHQLDDPAARTEMLQRSDDFLRAAFQGLDTTH
jgi:predicted esterase